MLHDLRYAIRLLGRNPIFTLATTLTLALAIGGTTAMFTVVDAALLRPLPFAEPDDLVWGWGQWPQSDSASISPPDFVDYRARARAVRVAAMTAFGRDFALSGAGEPESISGRLVSAGLFETLGVVPAMGRSFAKTDEDVEDAEVAVLSDGLWRRRFGADPSILGRRLTVDARPVTIVGVMPRGFAFPQGTDLWLPLPMRNSEMQVRRFHFLRIVGRVAGGSTFAAAQADLDAIAARLAEAHPDSNQGWRVRLAPLREQLVGSFRVALLLLFGAVACVLLIACANIASLFLARSGARRRELAVRAALGASRWRLSRQLLVESVTVAALGGAGGLLLAIWSVQLLAVLGPRDLVTLRDVSVDGRVLAFTALVSLVSGILFGIAPAVQAGRLSLRDALTSRGAGPSRQRARALLVAGELSLAAMLLMGAGLLLRSFTELLRVDAGFRAGGVLTATLRLPPQRYADAERMVAFAEQLEEAVRTQPGVSSAAVTSRLPMAPQGGDTYFTIVGQPEPAKGKPTADIRAVTPGYFQTMDVPFLRGRDVARTDRTGAPPVVVVNEPFARAFLPGRSALGERLVIDLGRPMTAEIVGVVGGVRHYGLENEATPAMYVPFAQVPNPIVNVVARAEGSGTAAAGGLRSAVHGLDATLPVDVGAMSDLVARSAAQPRLRALLVGGFAAVAILLAAIGVYGVAAGAVSERRREIGIRMALGARATEVVSLVTRESARLAVAGLVIGVAGALSLSRVVAGLLFGVRPLDAATLAGVVGVMLAATLIATAVPARRAARVDPATALRDE
jgi:putative ABC transport system permease protein